MEPEQALQPLSDDTRWKDFGLCVGMDPNLFFIQRHQMGYSKQKAKIKKMCAKCPVQSKCLDWALRNNEEGMWGGTTEDERKAIKAEAYARQRARMALPKGAV